MVYGLTAIDYRIEEHKPVIYLFTRDESLNRKIFKVGGFKPYYYYKDIFGEYPIQGIDGSYVTKKVTRLPSDVSQERDKHHFTYESDILFPIRFMVDRGIRYGLDVKDGEVVPANFTGSAVRPLFLDIEVETPDRNVFPEPRIAKWMILAVTIWCPIDGNPACWRFEIETEEEEKEFLETFVKIIEEFDPDLITAYNVFFDMCTILKRMSKHKVDTSKLSPLGHVSIADKSDEIKIAGRNVFDYYKAYKKYITKVLPSFKLEDVALKECDFPKSDYPIERMLRQYIDDVADYNLLDVGRMIVLENKLELVEFYDNIRAVYGGQFDQAFEASKYVDILLLRYAKDKFLLPRKAKGKKKQDYVGAVVLPPKRGVHKNVAFLDFSKMYPSILISYNISPETLRLTKPKEPHYVLPVGMKYKDELGEEHVDWQEVYYLKEPKGLLPQIAEDLIALRQETTNKMLKAPRGSELFKHLWHRQYSLKFVLNAMYGVFAYPKFRLFNPYISASMTGQGRRLSLRTIDYVKTLGYEAIYGDTDGLYFPVGDDGDPIEIGKQLNEKVNEFWEKEKDKFGLYEAPSVKLEYVFESIMLARKKRYSAMVIYDNGEETHELKIVGFEPRRSDSAKLSQDLQRNIFKLIHDFKPLNEIINYIKGVVTELPNMSLDYFAVPLPLRTKLSEMKNVARVKSIVYGNEFLDQKMDTGSRPYEFYTKTVRLKGQDKKDYGFRDKPILPWGLPTKFKLRTWSPKEQMYVIKEYIADRVAFNGIPPEHWRPFIDMDMMVEKVIWNKVESILSALGMSEEDRIDLYGSKRPIKKEDEE
jgi:DNA polymerase I